MQRQDEAVSADENYRRGHVFLIEHDREAAAHCFQKAQTGYDQLITAVTEELEDVIEKQPRSALFIKRGNAYLMHWQASIADNKMDGSLRRPQWAGADSRYHTKAIENFTRAIKLNPHSIEAYTSRANAYLLNNQLEEAMADYSQTYAIDPRCPAYKEACLRLGEEDKNKERLDESIANFLQVTKLAPNEAKAYFNLGFLYFSQKNYSEAITYYQQAFKLDPECQSMDAHMNHKKIYFRSHQCRGDNFLAQKKYAEAIVDYTAAYRMEESARVLGERAIAYLETGNFAAAIADYTVFLKAYPNHSAGFANLGTAYQCIGDFVSAIANYNQALILNPDLITVNEVDIYMSRGMAYAALGHHTSAISDFTRLLKSDDEDAYAYIERGISYLAENNFAEAVSDCTQALRFGAKPIVAHLNRGLAYQSLGNCSLAITDLTEVLKIEPNNGCALKARGESFHTEGDTTRAIDDYTHFLQINLNDERVRLNRGLAYLIDGDLESAISDFTLVIKQNPQCELAYVHRSKAYLDLKRYEGALADVNQALALAPSFCAYLNRGLIYKETHQLDLAITDLNEAIHLNSTEALAYSHRGLAHVVKEDFGAAILDFTKAIDLAPKDADAFNNCGVCYLYQGYVASAIPHFMKALKIDPNHEKTRQNLVWALESKDKDFYRSVDKKMLFHSIKLLPQSEQIRYFLQSLDQATPLGRRFWEQRFFTKCRLKSGTLKQIYLHLKAILPTLNIDAAVKSSYLKAAHLADRPIPPEVVSSPLNIAAPAKFPEIIELDMLAERRLARLHMQERFRTRAPQAELPATDKSNERLRFFMPVFPSVPTTEPGASATVTAEAKTKKGRVCSNRALSGF